MAEMILEINRILELYIVNGKHASGPLAPPGEGLWFSESDQ